MAKANPEGEVELDKLKHLNRKTNNKQMNRLIKKKGKKRR